MKHNGLLYLMITGILLGVFCGWFYGETMLPVGWLGGYVSRCFENAGGPLDYFFDDSGYLRLRGYPQCR